MELSIFYCDFGVGEVEEKGRGNGIYIYIYFLFLFWGVVVVVVVVHLSVSIKKKFCFVEEGAMMMLCGNGLASILPWRQM